MSPKKNENINYKAGFVGLIGQPNAGKSSLMNFLISDKVSIVTDKPQTTRRRILGIQNFDKGQIVFIDAPGLVKSTSGLNEFLAQEALDVIKNSDLVLAVLSIDESDIERNQEIIDLVKSSKKPWLGIITKTDLKDKGHRVLMLKELIESYDVRCLQVSNKKDKAEDRDAILLEILNLLPNAEAPLYDPELYTTESVRHLAEEVVREKCFELLNHEVPYYLAVQTRQFLEDAKPCPKIYMDILVTKESHKPIVIGKAAQNIKKIGELARKEIQKIMDVPKVYLELNVVVKENWYDQKKLMKELKYVVPTK